MFSKLTHLVTVALALIAIGPAVCSAADPNLVGWWRFDEGLMVFLVLIAVGGRESWKLEAGRGELVNKIAFFRGWLPLVGRGR